MTNRRRGHFLSTLRTGPTAVDALGQACAESYVDKRLVTATGKKLTNGAIVMLALGVRSKKNFKSVIVRASSGSRAGLPTCSMRTEMMTISATTRMTSRPKRSDTCAPMRVVDASRAMLRERMSETMRRILMRRTMRTALGG
jgi:hypothetical protein